MAQRHPRDAVGPYRIAERAFAADIEPVVLPAALRERVLAAARNEPQELPRSFGLRTRLAATWPMPVAVAVIAAAVLLTGSLYGLFQSRGGTANAAARAFLARSDTQRLQLNGLPLKGASGLVAFNTRGDAWLVVHHLPSAPGGRVYQIWILDRTHASPAGSFSGGAATSSIRLTKRLPAGSAVIAVSLEAVGGQRRLRGPLQFATGPV